MGWPMASRIFLIQADCHPASQSEIYLASVVDSAVSSCFLLDHKKGAACRKKTLPEIEHRLSSLLFPFAQSASQKPNSHFDITGGKGVITQWVHGEFIVSFETIHLVNTH